MSRRPIHTAYVRYNGEFPSSVNCDSAVIGFNDLGMKIVPFQGFGDVETDVNCGPEALVSGYIGDIKIALKKLGLPMPPELDYPDELKPFYGREIWKGTLKDAKEWPLSQGPVFVKPIEQKLFTGLVWEKSRHNRMSLAVYEDDTPVFLSNVVNFISEARCYILDGQILDVKRYKGSYSVGPAKEVVEAAVAAFKGPRAYAIDFGVTDEGKTLIVEVNDGFALGNYGLHAIWYARMIEARWEELTEPLL
jgi:hypothetical protein